jgi:hypothetical protein
MMLQMVVGKVIPILTQMPYEIQCIYGVNINSGYVLSKMGIRAYEG